jgi:predicted kinase
MVYPCDQCSSWWAVFLRPASRRSREFSPSKPQTPYLRVDRTEQTIVAWSALSHPLGPVGYAVAYELAQEQLQLHLDVIVECVNPIALTRDSWSKIAAENGAAILEVEVVCSDESEHRRRVETRTTDVEGLMKPAWAAVMEREYEPWRRKHLVVDSARMSAESAARLITSKIRTARTETSDPAPEDDAAGISYTGKGMTDEHLG